MSLPHDILLDESAFITASSEMTALEARVETLNGKLQEMYRNLTTALDTPAGKQLEITAEKVLIEPIDNLSNVVKHVYFGNSDTIVYFCF